MAATLDDVLAEMKNLVNLQTIGNTMQQAQQAMLSSVVSAATGRGGPGGGSPGQQGQGNQKWSFWKNTMAGRAFGQTSLGGSIQNAFGGGQKQLGQILGGTGASGTGGLGALGAMAARAAGGLSAVATVGTALNEFRKQIENSTTAQFAYYKQLSEFSGSMAVVTAQRELNEVLRSIRTGDAQSESASRLEEAENRRKSAAEPLSNAIENAKNEVLIQLNGALENMYKLILDGVNAVRKLANLKPLEKPEDDVTGAFGDAVLGLVAMAEKAEKEAKDAMAGMRGRGGLSGALPPGRLP